MHPEPPRVPRITRPESSFSRMRRTWAHAPRVVRLLMVASFVAFAGSMMPAPFSTAARGATDAEGYASGLLLLLFGWIGVIDGTFEWFANPLLGLAWLLTLLGRHRDGAGFGACALGLALSFAWRDRVMVDEAGHRDFVASLNAGYWLWVLSMLLTVVAALVAWRRARQAQAAP
jgi:hypothetical protein